MFTVTGQITNTGGAGTVAFQWLRNGVAGPTQSLPFSGAATTPVSETVAIALPPGAVSGSATVQLRLVTAPGTSSSALNLVCQQD
jgi:hypothetical protein